MQIKRFIFNPIQVNTYLIYNEQTHQAALIDAGCFGHEEEEELSRYIEEHKLKVEHLLNTHLHLDHQFGNAYVAQRYGILPKASEADEPLVSNVRQYAAAFGLDDELVKEQPLGTYLNDGEELDICGYKCQIIATPGHTPGGICLYFANEKTLFTGDTLFAGGIGRADLPGGDYGTLIRSLQKKIMILPDDTKIYCGHGPNSTIGEEKQMNPFL